MTTYYEFLKVQTSATPTEIETAYETQYNQWRRLVTHHDPNIVNQANQALQALETIRTTLTDPSKRSVYDAAIGLGGATGGLADPQALSQDVPAGGTMRTPPVPAMTPPRPGMTTPAAQQPASASLWICPKCRAENPEQTLHCFKCGTQLVRQCPECHQLTSLVATGFCGTCGYKYETAERRTELRARMSAAQQEMNAIGRGSAAEMQSNTLGLAALWIFGAVTFLSAMRSIPTLLGMLGLVTLGYSFWQYRASGGSVKELPAGFSDVVKNRKAITTRIGGHPRATPVWLWLLGAVMLVLGLLLDVYSYVGFYHEGFVSRLTTIVLGGLGVAAIVFAYFRTRIFADKRTAATTMLEQEREQKREELRVLQQEFETLEQRRTGS